MHTRHREDVRDAARPDLRATLVVVETVVTKKVRGRHPGPSNPVIRVKRIYNFLVIHASFVMLSHVFTVIYIIFMHFVGLTY